MTAQDSRRAVTNATILLEVRHLAEKVEANMAAVEKAREDHEDRLRKLEEANTRTSTVLSLWNGINSIGMIIAGLLGVKNT